MTFNPAIPREQAGAALQAAGAGDWKPRQLRGYCRSMKRRDEALGALAVEMTARQRAELERELYERWLDS